MNQGRGSILLAVAKNGLNGCFVCQKDLESLLPSEKAKEQLSPLVQNLRTHLTRMWDANNIDELDTAIQDFHKTMEELKAVARQNNASDFFWSAMGTLGEYVVCDVERKVSNI